MTAPGQSTLRVIYRYAHGGNLKARPAYFSKELALASFARAAGATRRIRVTFLVDGPLSPNIQEAMAATGEVLRGRFGSNRSSYRHAMTLARTRSVSESLIWFAEDDYLYEANSLSALLSASDSIPEASWFALSGPTPPQMLEMRRAQGPVHLPPLDRPGGVAEVDGRTWRRIDSTTSSFGGRASTVRRDERLLRCIPWTGAAWDRTTCLAIQGMTPYPWQHVLSDLLVSSTPRNHRAVRVAYRVGARVAVNLRARRRSSRRDVLVAPEVPLIGHLNVPFEDRPRHWGTLAAETARWAAETELLHVPWPSE